MSTWLTELDADAVAPSNRGPLHAQLSALLRSRIADGSLPAGADLPTEAELQDHFGVSRSVVRQALSSLSSDGLVRRGRGRGSVVAPRGEHHRLVQRLSGLSTQVPAVTTSVLALGPERDETAEAQLGVAEVTGLRRLRRAEGAPIALIHTWLPRGVGDDLDRDELTDTSLHAVLRTKYGIALATGRRQVRAVSASAALADVLDVPVGAPLLLLEGTTLDRQGVPVESFRTWHRADRFVFDVDVVTGEEPTEPAPAPAPATSPGHGDGPDAGPARPGPDDLARRAHELARDLDELARRAS
ncbi:GntR family transcriptional regulator [Frigoribacterium salinisoli]